MFYSQLLLSKKGYLGIVWLAAHCHKTLKKDQVHQTNISSSVDKIMYDEVPVVTHRILAFLLLGIVRIYSKKVEYLFQDCHEVLDKLFGLKTAKKAKRAGIGVSRTCYFDISLPKRFELDTFDLQLLEDQDLLSGNVRPHEHDVHADAHENAGATSGLVLKEKMPLSEAYTPPREMFSSHHFDKGSFASSSCNMNISLSGLEVLGGSKSPLENHVDPIELDGAEDAQSHDKISNKEITTNLQELTNNMAPSLEKIRGTAFSLEDRLDPMILDEVEKDQLNNDRPSSDNTISKFCGPVQDSEFGSPSSQGSDSAQSLGVVHKSSLLFQQSPIFKMTEKGQGHSEPSEKVHEVEDHGELLRSRMNFQEEEHCDFTGSLDAQPQKSPKKLKSLDVVTSESIKCHIPQKIQMSVVGTPESKLPEVATVRTPATKEGAKILKKKRKILFDSTIMVSNKIFKSWIDDPGDLKRKRRDVAHTVLHARRACKLRHPTQSFDIPELLLSIGQDDVIKSPVAQPVAYEHIGDMESSPPTPIAPGTPVTRLKSVRAHEAVGTVSDSPPTSSSDKSPQSLSRARESDFVFPKEGISFEGHNLGKDTYTARTRMIGSYLSRKFLDQKKHNEEQVLKLSQLLAGKTKEESARVLYEILVLKTQGCIDLEQENAYDDILVWGTCKLMQACQ